jgi:hypothetical protein
MRRPVGVVLAAIVLGAIALLGILFAGAGVVASIFVHSPVIPKLPGLRAVMIGSTALELSFFVFCAWTAVALVRLRPWARIAVLIVGGLVFFFSACGGFGMLLARHYAALLPAGPGAADAQMVLMGMVAFFFLLSLVGVWWLIYFNLGSVRAAFAGPRAMAAGGAPGDPAAVPARTSGWRIVIMVWAWLMLVSVLYLPIILWMRTPLFLFGAVLRGWAETLTMLGLWAVNIYMGLGLLRKWKPAWYLALAFQIYCIAFFASLLLPKVQQQFFGYEQESMRRWSMGAASQPGFAMISSRWFMGFEFALCLIVVFVLTWALIRRRADYLGSRAARV